MKARQTARKQIVFLMPSSRFPYAIKEHWQAGRLYEPFQLTTLYEVPAKRMEGDEVNLKTNTIGEFAIQHPGSHWQAAILVCSPETEPV